MDVALFLAHALLASVLVVASVTMLVDFAGTTRAMHRLGLPARLAVPLGFALPVIELAVTVALVVRDWAWWGAIGAFALLLAFSAAIALSLAQKRRMIIRVPGRLRSAPADWSSLSYTLTLAAVAAFVVWQGRGDPGPGMVSWIGGLSTLEAVTLGVGLLALALAAAVAWLAMKVLRLSGRLLLRVEALEAVPRQGQQAAGAVKAGTDSHPMPLGIGAKAPGFTLPEMGGATRSLEQVLTDGKLVVLVFMDPASDACRALMPEIGQWQREHARLLTFLLISRGSHEANAAIANQHGVSRVLLQRDDEVASAYRVTAMPSAVLVRPDGTLGSSIASGPQATRSLIRRVAIQLAPLSRPVPNPDGMASARSRSSVGQSAPDVTVSTSSGEPVSLQQFQGQRTLLLFWNPESRFCHQMLDDLRAWEVDPPPGAPRLVIVSTGMDDSNATMTLRAPVLIDQEFVAGRAFGAAGTPSAVLIDAEGRVASEVAIGASAILELAGAHAARAGSATG